MATGALDTNGIWIYGEDDPASPVSDLLNLGQDSVSDAVGDLKARVTTIENAASAAWTPYTPSLVNLTLGNGTMTARYKRVGTVIHVMGIITWGSTTSMTNPVIGLPVTASGLVSDRAPLGIAQFTDASAPSSQLGLARFWSGSTFVLYTPSGAMIAAAAPFTWAVSDSIGWNLTYEVA